MVFWVFWQVQSEEFEFADARVGGVGPEKVALGRSAILKYGETEGKEGSYHLVDMGINIFGWDMAIFFEQLAGVRSEMIGEFFVVPGIFLGVSV